MIQVQNSLIYLTHYVNTGYVNRNNRRKAKTTKGTK